MLRILRSQSHYHFLRCTIEKSTCSGFIKTKIVSFKNTDNCALQFSTGVSDGVKSAKDRETEEFLQMLTGKSEQSAKMATSSNIEDIDSSEMIDPNVLEAPTELLPDPNSIFDVASIIRKYLTFLHNQPDMSWAESIFTTSLTIRISLVFMHFMHESNSTQLTKHAVECHEFKMQYRVASLSGDKEAAEKAKRDLRRYSKKNSLPSVNQRFILMGVHLSTIMLQVMAVNQLARANIGGAMMTEKFYWVQHLALPDPSMLMPALASFLIAAYFFDSQTRYHSLKSLVDLNRMLALALASTGLFLILYSYTKKMPAAGNLCLAFNAGLSLAIILTFRVSFIRRLLKLPVYQSRSRQEFLAEIRKKIPVEMKEKIAAEKEAATKRTENLKNTFRLLFKDRKKFQENVLAMKEEKLNRIKKAKNV